MKRIKERTGRTMLLLLVCLFMFSLVSSAELTAVSKVYNSSEKLISLKDSIDKPVADYKLLSNECDEQKRFCNATLKTIFYQKGNLFEYLNFKRIIGNTSFFSNVRNYQVYLNTSGQKVNLTSVVCSPVKVVEGLDSKEDNSTLCEEVVSQVDAPEWSLYNNQLLEGTQIWLIKAEKRPSFSIDWIITAFKIPLSEWEIWENISQGDDAEIVLTSPTNNSIQPSLNVSTNASFNITNGAYGVNSTLWDNSSGNWGSRSSTIISSPYLYDHFNDSSINNSIWKLYTYVHTYGSGTKTITITEANDNLTLAGYVATNGDSYTIGRVSSNATSFSTIKNLNTSFYFSLQHKTSTLYSQIVVNFFGNDVLTIGPYVTSSGRYYISAERNSSNVSKFDYYVNGVYTGTITPSVNYVNYTLTTLGSDTFPCSGTLSIDFLNTSLYSANGNLSFTNSYVSSNSYVSNIQICDTDFVCAFSLTNRTFNIDRVNFSIHSSSSTSSSSYVVNATIQANATLQNCSYNITRGASTEVATTWLNCSNFTAIATLSGEADYVLHLFANQSGGISNTTDFNFTYSLVTPTPLFGGGGSIASLLPSTSKTLYDEMFYFRVFALLSFFVFLLERYNRR